MLVGFNFDGDLFADTEAVPLEADHFFGIVGQKTHLFHTQRYQDLRPDSIFPEIVLEAKLLVGLNRIEPVILLEFISL